jgi:hypothetical protein
LYYQIKKGQGGIDYLAIASDPKKPPYFVTPFINPIYQQILDVVKDTCDQIKFEGLDTGALNLNLKDFKETLDARGISSVIWMCSCPSFQQGKARAGENPFANPCKHVKFVLENSDKILKELSNV